MYRSLRAMALLVAVATLANAQSGQKLNLRTGKEIFQAACVSCHGADGRGAPDATAGFEKPETFPDFTDCATTTPEPDSTWRTIIHEGGAGRGFSRIMPSFAEALTLDQIDLVVKYLRSLCVEPRWPRGELNLPKALFTEKAFPEDEYVLLNTISTKGGTSATSQLTFEKRLSQRYQLELAIPMNLSRSGNSWIGGVGDIGLGIKHVLAASMKTGTIISVQGESIFATGNRKRGLGSGTTVFEGFVTMGQILPGNAFFQIQPGIEQPAHTSITPRAAYLRTAVGKSFTQKEGFGRMLTPIFETIFDHNYFKGSTTNIDVVPQIQITLNRRQHVRANFGWRQPVSNTATRGGAVMFYLLWDFFDGGLRDGWK